MHFQHKKKCMAVCFPSFFSLSFFFFSFFVFFFGLAFVPFWFSRSSTGETWLRRNKQQSEEKLDKWLGRKRKLHYGRIILRERYALAKRMPWCRMPPVKFALDVRWRMKPTSLVCTLALEFLFTLLVIFRSFISRSFPIPLSPPWKHGTTNNDKNKNKIKNKKIK